jgi:hypothetical protein
MGQRKEKRICAGELVVPSLNEDTNIATNHPQPQRAVQYVLLCYCNLTLVCQGSWPLAAFDPQILLEIDRFNDRSSRSRDLVRAKHLHLLPRRFLRRAFEFIFQFLQRILVLGRQTAASVRLQLFTT